MLDNRGDPVLINHMVNYRHAPGDAASLDAVFGALADSSRRAILARLAEGPATVGELAEPLPMSLPAVSKHLKVMERAGLLTRNKEGRSHWLRLTPRVMDEAEEWMARTRAFWEARLDKLEKYLEGEKED